jgi:phosphate starvation-inducible PhoH-like protein
MTNPTKKANTEKRAPKGDITYKLNLTDEQKEVKRECYNYKINVITGEAGTSKTFTACQIALDMLFKRQIDRITIMRPTVATEDIGFLPGDTRSKLEGWLLPVIENFKALYDKVKIEKLLEDETIRILPLQFCQGVTYYNELCLLDESQNCTKEQLNMVMTRVGRGSTLLITGDIRQNQLKNKSLSGFKELLDLKGQTNLIGFHELKENYRDPVVREVLELYNK